MRRRAKECGARFIALSVYCNANRCKHRIFVWVPHHCPDHQLIVTARDDDTTFGILHSRFHEAWALRLCTWLGVGNDSPLHAQHYLRDLSISRRV